MKLCTRAVRPSTTMATRQKRNYELCCALATTQPSGTQSSPRKWERLVLDQSRNDNMATIYRPSFVRDSGSGSHYSAATTSGPSRLSKRWMEYQGGKNWEGLLDPLDDNLRGEIIRYGNFVEAAYRSFDFEPTSPAYGTCQHTKSSIFERSGFPKTGYKVTKNLRATSGIQLPRWINKCLSLASVQSSWIGYVAVCHDKEEIARLGRRDIVIALRGTATCLEWLENLRATLTHFSTNGHSFSSVKSEPMVESGFLSLYSSKTNICSSLQNLVREEITKIIQMYGNEPLSLTITGHSLGAALATLMAYDIKTTIKHALPVTVVSFGGPRVGNPRFRAQLEKKGAKILRIVNSDDVITKVPGFVFDDYDNQFSTKNKTNLINLFRWLHKCVDADQWMYANIGNELRLSSREVPHLNNMNLATCHDLKTYLHLVNCFESSSCPFRATARKMLNKKPCPDTRNTKQRS